MKLLEQTEFMVSAAWMENCLKKIQMLELVSEKNQEHYLSKLEVTGIHPNLIMESQMNNLDTVLLIGFDKTGKFILSASSGDAAGINYLLDLAKKAVFDCASR